MDQAILGTAQLRDTDRIASNHLGRDLGWVITGAENDDLGARDILQQLFEIAVGRDKNEVANSRVFQDSAITGTSKSISKGALGLGEEVAQELNEFRRQAFVEEELHPLETLRPAANSAA
jgi:hypothetical protein